MLIRSARAVSEETGIPIEDLKGLTWFEFGMILDQCARDEDFRLALVQNRGAARLYVRATEAAREQKNREDIDRANVDLTKETWRRGG
jgi:hypothetical protein